MLCSKYEGWNFTLFALTTTKIACTTIEDLGDDSGTRYSHHDVMHLRTHARSFLNVEGDPCSFLPRRLQLSHWRVKKRINSFFWGHCSKFWTWDVVVSSRELDEDRPTCLGEVSQFHSTPGQNQPVCPKSMIDLAHVQHVQLLGTSLPYNRVRTHRTSSARQSNPRRIICFSLGLNSKVGHTAH